MPPSKSHTVDLDGDLDTLTFVFKSSYVMQLLWQPSLATGTVPSRVQRHVNCFRLALLRHPAVENFI